MAEIIEINGINKRGEGQGTGSSGPINVPFTLTGEKVEIEVIPTKDKTWGQLTKILQPSADRVDPSCVHYGTCGGCSLQHHNPASYAAFKKKQVTQALHDNGLHTGNVEEPIIIGSHHRRRVDFLARKYPDGFNMGYYQIHSRRRIHLQECPLVEPRIESLFKPLYAVLEDVLEMKELVHIFILSAENGLDVLLAGFKRTLSESDLTRLFDFAKDNNLARLAYKIKKKSHTIYCQEPPYVTFAGHKIDVNPNVFLQASTKADTILADLVVQNIPTEATCVIDLFCGRGTLTLPIHASGRRVHGYEGDKNAIAALQELEQENLSAQTRDLFANPLSAEELKGCHTLVMNPPRSGVKNQIQAIIDAKTPTVIYVSCNPETFAKDMATLCEGGYTLKKAIPVDQFMWSHHVEVVGIAVRDDKA
ncbi:MAG: class I SAM-dependent RNA methyltransferase [Alphaproteobacteria bacterium]|nr:class I SAM-dependent RNA methyltransferase [Alphaproteobacteria bacterium]